MGYQALPFAARVAVACQSPNINVIRSELPEIFIDRENLAFLNRYGIGQICRGGLIDCTEKKLPKEAVFLLTKHFLYRSVSKKVLSKIP